MLRPYATSMRKEQIGRTVFPGAALCPISGQERDAAPERGFHGPSALLARSLPSPRLPHPYLARASRRRLSPEEAGPESVRLSRPCMAGARQLHERTRPAGDSCERQRFHHGSERRQVDSTGAGAISYFVSRRHLFFRCLAILTCIAHAEVRELRDY
jgi:hypothetical protein